jgi:hypothetical protein
MRRLVSIVALLLLLSTAAPLLACVAGSAMSQEEKACCRAMHGNCGEMAKMGCCRTEIRTDEYPQIAATAPSINLQWAVVAWLAPNLLPMQDVPHPLLAAPDEHSPPGLLTARFTVLRI